MKILQRIVFAILIILADVDTVEAQIKSNIPKTQEEPKKRNDNYTVQYLIVCNAKNEVLLQKNNAGWHTFAIRSNESQSVHEAMDSLANTLGLRIASLNLVGLYVYKFEGLPDHKEASFRMHFRAELAGGRLVQPTETDREYRWFTINEAIEKITFESLKLETSQILNNPQKIWGGTFLIRWKDGKFLGSRVLEEPYSLTN